MSRLRKVYKGEESWDVIYNEQEQILGKDGKDNVNVDANTNINSINDIPTVKLGQPVTPSPATNFKQFTEDKNSQNSHLNSAKKSSNTHNTYSSNFNHNLSNVKSISATLNFNANINSTSNTFSNIANKLSNVSLAKDKDLVAIDNDNENEEDDDVQTLYFETVDNNVKTNSMDVDSEPASKAGNNNAYKYEKRKFNDAFGTENADESLNEEDKSSFKNYDSKKKKMD